MKKFIITPALAWSRYTKLALCSVLLLGLADCTKKGDIVAPTVGGRATTQNLDTPPLDWENISFMPGNGPTTVPVPWGIGNSNSISDDIIFDYKSIDGWVLVANTFTPTATPDYQYFVLYNRYRGLFRMYHYRPANATTIESTNIVNTLSTAGSGMDHLTSSILNFANQTIIDPSVKSSYATTTEPLLANTGTWYAFEYELAYDPSMSGRNYENFFFRWPLGALKNVQLTENGHIRGDINGKLNLPDVSLSLTGGTQNINSRGGTQVVNGTNDADKLLASLGRAAVDGIKQGITNGISGVVSGFLGGIFGSSSGQPINMKVNEDISLTGTLTSNLGLGAVTLNVPGVDQTGSKGYDPAYNYPLGVFNLTNRPLINIKTTRGASFTLNGETFYHYVNNLTVDANAFQAALVINNAVNNQSATGASVAVAKTEVVLLDKSLPIKSTTGTKETLIGTGQSIITGTGFNVFIDSDDATAADEQASANFQVAVRVTIKVTPNNTKSSPVTIVKTFVADPNYM